MSSLVVLVPCYGGSPEPECERGLRELERRGVEVRRVGGNAAIDQARSQMATDALADGFDELLWIDSDVGFDADAVSALRDADAPIVAGLYAKKGKRELACHVLPGTTRLTFGDGGGLVEVRYVATGFLLVRRAVFEQLAADLPVCNEHFERPVVPYFLPAVIDDPTRGRWYLGEDYAFCERARRAGFRILADTRIRLFHVGRYAFGWEDAGSTRDRFATYDYELAD